MLAIMSFECVGCGDAVSMARKPKLGKAFCGECQDFRDRARGKTGRKHCKGCGVYMPHSIYGKRQFCDECTVIRESRHNGCSDPYATPKRLLVAANYNVVPTHRDCTQCERELPLDAFQRHSKGAHGRASVCKECRNATREDRADEYQRRCARRYGSEFGSRIKRRRLLLIDRFNRKRRDELRKLNGRIKKYLSDFARWRLKPWSRPGLSEAEKYRIRYALDSEFNLRQRTRQRLRRKGFGFNALWRMRQSLNGEIGEVATSTIEYALGYSMEDLRAHLEARFTDGMTWQAFREGRIHIDHMNPLSRFDLDDPTQAAEAWALSNLQPLWAEDNMAKGARTMDEWLADNDNAAAPPRRAARP